MEQIGNIQGNKLFQKMNADQIEKLMVCANPIIHQYGAKEIILQQGIALEYIFIILSGEVNLLKEDYEGNRSLVGVLTQNDIYGQLSVFGENQNNIFIVEAASDCRVMLIGKWLFYQQCSNTCETHQRLIQNMLFLLANQANILDQKINYLTAKSLRCKIARFLLEQCKIHGGSMTFSIALNREALAEYFDVQRPSLSRELIKLKEEGVIDFYKYSFKILDMERLKQFAK